MVFLFISQNLNLLVLDIDNENNKTSWILELMFKNLLFGQKLDL